MFNQNKFSLFLLTVILLFSCGKSNSKQQEEIAGNSVEQQTSLFETSIINLSNKYNAIRRWDTLVTFTYELQEMLIDQDKLVSFEGRFMDVIKTDSSYLLIVMNSRMHFNRNYMAQITISQEDFNRLRVQLSADRRFGKGCFIMKVSKITTASPEIKSDSDLQDQGLYSYLFYDFQESLIIFKGELIDFCLNEVITSPD